MAAIDTPEGARRLARTIASDISLYNEDKIARAVKNDDVFVALEPEIREGLQLYESRVDPDLRARSNFFYRAIVDVVLRSKGSIPSKMW
ncbi:MAG TPA: hypothetical protein RMG48_15310 [Myxococcales bacterium LLY-WYZ-16_1]|jgi:hypothetical protein|nr:hypothetical protein [Myxococcales bacterium LLY-WYZ-16_1]